MRVLFITNLYPPHSIGGYEENCRDMADMLRNVGHDVSVLTSTYRAYSAPDTGGVYRLLKARSDWPAFSNRRTFAHFRKSLAADWRNKAIVRRVVSKLAPDVVVVWSGVNLGWAVVAAVQKVSPLIVYYLEDGWLAQALMQVRPRPLRLELTLLRGLGLAAPPVLKTPNLIFCSRALLADYQRLGADVTRAAVIHSGISLEVFTLRPQRIIQRPAQTPFRVLFVGRITPEKGVTTLIKALSALRQRTGFQNTTLSLVGVLHNPAFGTRVRSIVKDLGMEAVVQFIGQRPRSELPSIYEQHDVAVFPSEYREPFGLSLIEAMAVGSPVVTSVEGGPAEIVRDHENAVVFRAGDANDLADRLAWVLQNPIAAAEMGRRAHRDVHQRFTLEAQRNAFETYLVSLMGTSYLPYRDEHAVAPIPSTWTIHRN
jgi:glycogen(starch) synthase